MVSDSNSASVKTGNENQGNDDNDSPPQVGAGASQLMGLFAPPPGSTDVNNAAGEGNRGNSNSRAPSAQPETKPKPKPSTNSLDTTGAQGLMNLFAPPTPVPTKQPTSGADEGKDSANGSGIKIDGVNEDSSPIKSDPFADNTDAHDNFALAGSSDGAKQLSGLFQRPSSRPQLGGRQTTLPRSNKAGRKSNDAMSYSEQSPLLSTSKTSMGSMAQGSSPLLGQNVGATEITPKTRTLSRKTASNSITTDISGSHRRMPSVALPAIVETHVPASHWSIGGISRESLIESLKTVMAECAKPTTYIGSFMFLLYHVVFCLAMGSAIVRPHNPTSILGLMTKTAALGSICSGFVYWLALSSQIPALYPTTDLFLAPFLANLAAIVDATLASDENVTTEENDAVFLATFSVLSGIGLLTAGILLILASVFKLANLGSFLPFPVICGFFSAVGVLTWTLAIAVDTGGKSVGYILKSGDVGLYLKTLYHHAPSVAIASIMKYLGPRNPFYVVFIVLGSIGMFYVVMFVSGFSIEDARKEGWFWTRDDLVYIHSNKEIGFDSWSPPAPFGVLNELRNGIVHWGAVYNGLSTTIALGFLYLIRCSVHATALKKNVPNLNKVVPDDDQEEPPAPPINNKRRHPSRAARFSDAVDIEAVMASPPVTAPDAVGKSKTKVVYAEPTSVTLKEILLQYGYSMTLSAFIGGFAVAPSVAAAPTMYGLGAEGVAPQVGSILLLLVFYLTDFAIVQFIPKPAFSSMLVLAFIDMIFTWFYKSYFKTKSKSEWLVVPAIVVCAFTFDLLSSVFLGIAMSTFIFVASFNRSGVVKYVATGNTIHSTIERPFKSAEWLNENGHLIQIVVLQNYLFFGNATSVYNYILTMFDVKPEDNFNEVSLKPKYVVIDCTLVTGCDTSTVDVFNDIKMLCKTNGCKLMMSGLSSSIRSILALGGFKPDTGVKSKRQVRFFIDLDTAMGKSEDLLLESYYEQKDPSLVESRRRLLSEGDHGFRTSLRHIDEQHGDCYSMDLVGLQEYTSVVELEPGDDLYDFVESQRMGRGLFFIESGILKVVQDTGATMTRGSSATLNASGTSSIGQMNARSVGRNSIGAIGAFGKDSHSFRLARIGPGWIAGANEAVSGVRRQGNYLAVTHCRLHHLPYDKVSMIEKDEPSLVLNLYKLLSFMMARRQEATIGQLATLHSIMTSPPHHSFIRRKAA